MILELLCLKISQLLTSSLGDRLYRLPIDLIYGTGPQVVENQSVGEYATSLKNIISAVFDLVFEKYIITPYQEYIIL